MARQSVKRLLAKQAARTVGKRAITDRVGTGLLGSILKTIFSQGVKALDKKVPR